MDNNISKLLRKKAKDIDTLLAMTRERYDELETNFEIEREFNFNDNENIELLDSKKAEIWSLSNQYHRLSLLRTCWARIRQAYDNNSTKVSLSGLMLEEIPTEIKLLKNLEFLDIRNNQLTTLPKEIGNLRKLKSLYI